MYYLSLEQLNHKDIRIKVIKSEYYIIWWNLLTIEFFSFLRGYFLDFYL